MCLLVFKTSVGRESVLGEFDSHTPSPESKRVQIPVLLPLPRQFFLFISQEISRERRGEDEHGSTDTAGKNLRLSS